MLTKFYNYLYDTITNKAFQNNQELRLHLTMSVANVFCLSMHVLLLIIFSVIGIPTLIIFNSLSILVYLSCFFLIRKKHYEATGLLISFEVSIYTIFSVFYMGIDTYFIVYFLLVLILQMIIPYTTIWVRVGIIAFLWLAVMSCLLIGVYQEPIITFTSDQKLFLLIFNGYVAIFATIIELTIDNLVEKVISYFNKKRFAELEQEAYTDPLTSLYNRRYATEVFESLKNHTEQRTWCVAMVDIDDFKLVNDRYGHAIGDIVLKTLADLMVGKLRKTDLVFRWGGEEFLLLLDGIDEQAAFVVLDKLRQSIGEQEMLTGEDVISITVTMGIETLDLDDIMGSIDRSDRKLYVGKADGKNQCVV